MLYVNTRKNTRNIPRKIKIYILIHENAYTTIIAANTRIHDTRNFDARAKP